MHNKPVLVAMLVSVGCILSLPNALGSPPAGQTSDAITEADKLFKSGKFSDAIASFDKAISLNPKCIRATWDGLVPSS
ncbi:MAG: tetratricopeptide repeat protein [Cyanobacteria bacterium]|nr:tetratricopeptide repeat protein [Cyanobacteriota bacterium]